MAFSGWPEEALDFYDGLAADNTKTYWTEHKAVYTEKVLGPMTELTEELAAEFGEPKIFRPYRDIRFSKDKTPYKTHIGATVGDSCYVQLSVEGLGAGAGMWEMNPGQLARYREAVAGDRPGAELVQIVAGLEKAGITVHGHGALKSAPRGSGERPPPPARTARRPAGRCPAPGGSAGPGHRPGSASGGTPPPAGCPATAASASRRTPGT